MSESLERRGPPHLRRWARVLRGARPLRSRRLGRRGDDGRRPVLLAEAHAGGPSYYLEPPCRALRSAIRLARGDRAGAADDAAKGLAAGRRAQDVQVPAPALWSGSRGVSLKRADADRGRPARLRATRRLAARRLEPHGTGAALPGFVWTLEELECSCRAGAAAAPTPPSLAVYRAAAAIVAGGPRPARSARSEAIGNRGGESGCRLRWAETLIAEGRAGEADGVGLAPAVAFYRSVGATLLLARAEARLTARA